MLDILKFLTGPKPYYWHQVTKRSEKGQQLTDQERQVVSRRHCPDCGGKLSAAVIGISLDSDVRFICKTCGFGSTCDLRHGDRLILIGHNKCPSQKKN